MRDYENATNAIRAEESYVTVPTVHTWTTFPTCAKCGLSVGFGLPVIRWILLFTHGRVQQWGHCKGDHNSTMKVQMNMLGAQVQTELPVECFGLYSDHLHLACVRCGFRWLMECAPAPVSRPWIYYARQFLKWFFLLLGIGAFIFLCLSAAQAQALPDDPVFAAMSVPKPRPHLTRSDWMLFAADEGVRSLDAYSTERALRCACNYEKNMPAIAAHPAAEWAYSLAVPVAHLGLSAYLERHHHARWAKVPTMFDIAYDLPQGVHNLTLRDSVTNGLRRLGK